VNLIQLTLVVPALLTLAMGYRTRKMSCATVIIVSCYWLVTGIETADLIAIDILITAVRSLHAIVSSAAIIAIASILSSSYAVVTLCSFISPSDGTTSPRTGTGNSPTLNAGNPRTRLPTFDALYRVIVGASGILFAEVPLVVVRSQVIAVYYRQSSQTLSRQLPVVFILWLIKNTTFILIAMVLVAIYTVRVRRKVGGDVLCNACGRMAFDNPDVFFAPEKRDTYIAEQHRLTAPLGIRKEVPRVRGQQQAVNESDSLVDDSEMRASTSSAAYGATKKSKKSVTFQLDLDQDGHQKCRSGDVCRSAHDNDDDADSDDDDDTKV